MFIITCSALIWKNSHIMRQFQAKYLEHATMFYKIMMHEHRTCIESGYHFILCSQCIDTLTGHSNQ